MAVKLLKRKTKPYEVRSSEQQNIINLHPRWYCKDCGKSTFNDRDYYGIVDAIWRQYGVREGMLCVNCFEKRLGRKLQPEDLLDCPLNKVFNVYTREILKKKN